MTEPLIGVVEDDENDFYAYRRAFAGIATIRRWTDAEALIRAILDEPGLLGSLGLLLVDLGLPGMDGVQLAATLRRAPGATDLPIIILTGSDSEADIVRALDAGVTEYEIKPRDRHELQTLVNRTLPQMR